MKILKQTKLQNLNNDEKVDFENLQVTSEVEIPKTDTFETIKTPNQTSFDNTKPIVETLQPVVSTPVNIPVEKDLEQVGFSFQKEEIASKPKEDIAFSIEEQRRFRRF
jgi:hypothetical protein